MYCIVYCQLWYNIHSYTCTLGSHVHSEVMCPRKHKHVLSKFTVNTQVQTHTHTHVVPFPDSSACKHYELGVSLASLCIAYMSIIKGPKQFAERNINVLCGVQPTETLQVVQAVTNGIAWSPRTSRPRTL